jgi:hypothetical protein
MPVRVINLPLVESKCRTSALGRAEFEFGPPGQPEVCARPTDHSLRRRGPNVVPIYTSQDVSQTDNVSEEPEIAPDASGCLSYLDIDNRRWTTTPIIMPRRTASRLNRQLLVKNRRVMIAPATAGGSSLTCPCIFRWNERRSPSFALSLLTTSAPSSRAMNSPLVSELP